MQLVPTTGPRAALRTNRQHSARFLQGLARGQSKTKLKGILLPDDKIPSSRRRKGAVAFAIVSGDHSLREPLAKLCQNLGEQLNLVLYPQVLRSYGELSAQLASGRVDLAWAPPLVAIDLTSSGVAHILACLERGKVGMFHSVLFVLADSGLKSMAQLEGQTVAWVDKNSAAGYVVPRRWMKRNGMDPSSFFSREIFAGTHENVAQVVMRGEASVGATHARIEPRSRRVLHAGWFPEVDGRADTMEVVGIAGAVPPDVVVGTNRLAPDTRASITEALLSSSAEHRGLVASVFKSDGFQPCLPSHLAALEKLRE